jgi:hypothetical protein
MNYSDLRPHLKDLKADLRDELERKAKTDARVAFLQQTIDGIEGLIGPEPDRGPSLPGLAEEEPASTNGQPYGTRAIRMVLAERPDRTWKAKDIHGVLEQRGWLSPNAQHTLRGVEAAINRMWRTDELERVGPGRYRLKEVSNETGSP